MDYSIPMGEPGWKEAYLMQQGVSFLDTRITPDYILLRLLKLYEFENLRIQEQNRRDRLAAQRI